MCLIYNYISLAEKVDSKCLVLAIHRLLKIEFKGFDEYHLKQSFMSEIILPLLWPELLF